MMYENVTYELLLERMLGRVSDKFDKREGSVIWDSHYPEFLRRYGGTGIPDPALQGARHYAISGLSRCFERGSLSGGD